MNSSVNNILNITSSIITHINKFAISLIKIMSNKIMNIEINISITYVKASICLVNIKLLSNMPKPPVTLTSPGGGGGGVPSPFSNMMYRSNTPKPPVLVTLNLSHLRYEAYKLAEERLYTVNI